MKIKLLSVIEIDVSEDAYGEDADIREVIESECTIFESELCSHEFEEVTSAKVEALQTVVNKLLDLHCFNCDGERYGCSGCTIENQILEILTK